MPRQPTAFDLATVLVRNLATIAVGAFLGTVLGLVAAVLTPSVYEAEARLVALEPQYEGAEDLARDVTPTLQELVKSAGHAAEVIDELQLGVRPSELLAESLAVTAMRNTTLVRVRAFDEDPEVAKEIANRMATKAVELTGELSSEQTSTDLDVIRRQRDDAQQRLEAVTQQLVDFRAEAQLESLRREIAGLLEQKERLVALRVGRASERARLEMIQTILAQTPESRRLSGPLQPEFEAGEGMNVRIDSEFMNPTYEMLQLQLAETQTHLGGIDSEIDQIETLLERLTGLENRRFALEATEGSLQQDRDTVAATAAALTTDYDRSWTRAATRTTRLRLVDAAIAPAYPASPSKAVYTLVGSILGILGAMVAVVGWAFVRAVGWG